MQNNRRDFLMSAAGTSLAGIAMAAGTPASTGAAAPSRQRTRSGSSQEMPRGMTLLSIRSENGDTLGVKTKRGILDVRRASLALRLPAPLTLDDLLQQGGASELAQLVAAAEKSSSAAHLHVDEAQITHGRLFAEPGDLIFTGRPPGVILGMPKERQVWLKAGDQIACSVGDLGELRFTLA